MSVFKKYLDISCLCDGTKFPGPKQCENLDSEVPEVDGAYYLFAEYRAVPALKDLDPMDAAMHMIEKVSAAGCTRSFALGHQIAAIHPGLKSLS